MLARITKTEMLSADVRLIRFESTDEILPLPEAGSHIELNIPIEGKYVSRQYSLVSPLDQHTHYEIAVKRNIESRGGSVFLHDKLSVGDQLEISQPISGFGIAPEGKHHILIAGGIGITPMLSIIFALNKVGASYELHYSNKTETDMAFRSHFLKQNLDNVFLYFTGGEQSKRIDIDKLLEEHNDQPDTHVYVCGPTRLIESVRLSAEGHGFPRNLIHFESFGPSWESSDGVVRLVLTESAVEVEVNPGTTLLDAMEAAGIWIPSDCKRGECGACITSYSVGNPVHRDHCLTVEQRTHSFCPCVSWASPNTELSVPM